MDEKMIRFADGMNRELFTLPDGDKIALTEFNGKRSLLPCKYIDDYHAEIDGYKYIMSEFARIQEREGAVFAPNGMRPEDACGIYEVYQIKNTAATDYAYRSFEEAGKNFDPLDYRRVYTSMLPQRMTLNEVFARHNDENRPFGDKIRSMSISDIVIISRDRHSTAHYADTYGISGFTPAPQFLEPKTVAVTERETVEGYTVTVSIPEGKNLFVLAENPKAPQPFVTWQGRIDSKGFAWGHYFDRRADAVKDLYKRVCNERDNSDFSPPKQKNRDDAR